MIDFLECNSLAVTMILILLFCFCLMIPKELLSLPRLITVLMSIACTYLCMCASHWFCKKHEEETNAPPPQA